MLCICTEKEATFGSGASVPTTKAGAVTAFELVEVAAVVPLQPRVRNVATGNDARAIKSMREILNDMVHFAFCAAP